MKIVIIEDEKLMAKDLCQTLAEVVEDIQILGVLPSVEDALHFFSHNRDADLIFSDIELEDGLSFEIFDRLKIDIPVIFCTAYDEYALQAFQANGVEYILKPFNKKSLQKSIEKFQNFKNAFQKNLIKQYKAALDTLEIYRKKENNVFIYRYRNQVMPISYDKIAVIFIENEITYILTHYQRQYAVSFTLDDMEKKAGGNFFRANRQFLLNRNAVKELENLPNRKLKINLTIQIEKEILVSKEKSSSFLTWLEGG